MGGLARAFQLRWRQGLQIPARIVLGNVDDGSVVIMVTSSANKLHMEHDYLLIDWEAAGLAKPSIARIDRIATIPTSYLGTMGRIGRLTGIDVDAISETLAVIENQKKSSKPTRGLVVISPFPPDNRPTATSRQAVIQRLD